MQITLASALCFVFVSTSLPLSAVAQSIPTKTNQIQPLTEKLADAGSSAALRGTDSGSVRMRVETRDEPPQRMLRRFLDRPQGKAPIEPMPCDKCAHILILRPPANLDSEMVRQVPEDLGGPITTYPALPPCPGDFRGTLKIPGAPTPMLMGPRRSGLFFLNSRKLLRPDQP